MLFSIIIPYFNSHTFLNRLFITLEDYINEECEIIIVDDHSDYESYQNLKNKINSYNSNNIKLLRNDVNLGPSFSRQIAIDISSGNFVAFLDSDDGWVSRRIFTVCNYMIKNNIDICGGSHQQIECEEFLNLRTTKVRYPKNLQKLNIINFLIKNYYATSSVVVRRQILLNNGFNTCLRYSEDYELWRRLVFHGNAVYLDHSGSFCFKHVYISDDNKSLSSQTNKMLKSEVSGMIMLSSNPNIPNHIKLLIPSAILLSSLKYVKRIIHINVRKLSK